MLQLLFAARYSDVHILNVVSVKINQSIIDMDLSIHTRTGSKHKHKKDTF